jgi:SAM-dependent methyltransferase
MVRPRTFVILAGTAAAAVAVLRHGRRATQGHRVAGGILIGHAGVYDTISRLLLGSFAERIAADVTAVAPAGARVLEVGCGPGHLSIRLARLGFEVAGLDLDPAMIARAQANADRLGNGRRPASAVISRRRRGRGGIPGRILRPGRQHPVDALLGRPDGWPGRDRPRAAPRRPGAHLGLPARRSATSVRTTPRAPARSSRPHAWLSA